MRLLSNYALITDWLVRLAVKSCEKKDLPMFMMPFTMYLKKHPDYEKSMVLMLLDIFSRPECLGSASRASARIIAAIDYMPTLGVTQRGGRDCPHHEITGDPAVRYIPGRVEKL